MKEVIEDMDLSRMIRIVEKKLLEEDYTSLDLAAALLRLNMGEENQDIIDDYREARSLDDLERYSRGGRGSKNYGGRESGRGYGKRRLGEGLEARGAHGRRNRAAEMATLFLNVGKDQNVKSGDILGAVAGESGIPGKWIGSIDMYDKYTFVEVPKDCAEEVLECMKRVKIRGKSVKAERANRRG